MDKSNRAPIPHLDAKPIIPSTVTASRQRRNTDTSLQLQACPRLIPRSLASQPSISKAHSTVRNYTELVVTQINDQSSKERLRKLIKESKQHRNSLNWHAVNDDCF